MKLHWDKQLSTNWILLFHHHHLHHHHHHHHQFLPSTLKLVGIVGLPLHTAQLKRFFHIKIVERLN